jgi:multiple sugar transport system permease protein
MLRTRWYGLVQKYEPWFFLAPALILILIVVIYPVIYGTVIGFFEEALPGPAGFVGLKNFGSILDDSKYQRAVVTTLIYTFSTVVLSFGLGFGAALLLNSITWGRDTYRLILIAPMAVAPLVAGLTWRWMLDPLLGAVNWIFDSLGLPIQTWLSQKGTALASVIVIDVWQWYALILLIISAGLAGLPREPYEAAELDGASEWKIFWRITVPMLRPVILVALLLRMIDAFRTFDIVRVVTDGGPAFSTETLSLYLYRLGFKFFELNEAGAGAMLMLLMIGLVTGILFKYLYEELGSRTGRS